LKAAREPIFSHSCIRLVKPWYEISFAIDDYFLSCIISLDSKQGTITLEKWMLKEVKGNKRELMDA